MNEELIEDCVTIAFFTLLLAGAAVIGYLLAMFHP